jgi:hypothetical protein
MKNNNMNKIIALASSVSKKQLVVMLSLFVTVVFFTACEKYELLKKKNQTSTSTAAANYFVHLTDAPGNFTEVNIDIQSVLVKTSNGSEIELNVNPGVYNLLDFQNGVDTLIATGTLDSSSVSQIRLILGKNNSVLVDSVQYPLEVPSGSQSGLKLQVHHVLKAGVAYHVTLDFDANKSIVKTGNGRYKLKPVIRTIDSAISGSIKGMISPAGVSSTVSSYYNGDTLTTTPDINGYFLFKGLPAGSYDLNVTPISPYDTLDIKGVIVTIGNTTNVGTLKI